MYRNSILYIVMVVIILSIVIIPTTLFDVMLENDVNGFRAQINDILEMDWNDPELNDKCDALQGKLGKSYEALGVCRTPYLHRESRPWNLYLFGTCALWQL